MSFANSLHIKTYRNIETKYDWIGKFTNAVLRVSAYLNNSWAYILAKKKKKKKKMSGDVDSFQEKHDIAKLLPLLDS